MSVPIQAVVNREGCTQVKVQNDGKAEWRKVTLGARSLDHVVVTAGLSEKELVYIGRAQ